MPQKNWGNWKFRQKTNELVFFKQGMEFYAIDLDTIQTSAACLDWIFQVAFKTWMTDTDRSHLLRALENLVDPQARLCSWGIERSRP